MHLLCTSISEEGGDGEGVYMCERGEARQGESGSEAISLMSYILRYFSLVDIVRHGESTKKCYL